MIQIYQSLTNEWTVGEPNKLFSPMKSQYLEDLIIPHSLRCQLYHEQTKNVAEDLNREATSKIDIWLILGQLLRHPNKT